MHVFAKLWGQVGVTINHVLAGNSLIVWVFLIYLLVPRSRIHNNVLVYAETSGYVRTNKSRTNQLS